MSRRKKKSGLSYVLGIVRVLILIPVTYEIIMQGLTKVHNTGITATNVNGILNQEISSMAGVIVGMLVEFLVVYVVLELVSMVILRLAEHKKQ